MKTVVTALLGLLVVLSGLAAPAAAATPPDVEVVLPDVLRFNPTTTEYVVHVDGAPETGGLYAYVGHEPVPQQLNAPGDTTLDFAQDGEIPVTVMYCDSPSACGGTCNPNNPACGVLASETLSVYRSMRVAVWEGDWDAHVGHQSLKQVELALAPYVEGDPPELTWALTATPTEDAPALSAGTFADDAKMWTYHLPGDITSGKYWLRVTARRTDAVFGQLSGVAYEPVNVDTMAPRGRMQGGTTTLFPARDWHLDRALFELTTDDAVVVRGYEVRDLRDRLVRRDVEEPWLDPWDDSWFPAADRSYEDFWDGRLGQKLVPGTYLFRWVGFDAAENESVTRPVRVTVSDHRIMRQTWTRTFTAASTLVDREVGSCSTLRRPATRGWKGSLGYLSQTRCRRPQDSAVATLSKAYVPRVLGSGPRVGYEKLKLTMHGGGVAGRRSPYIVVNTIAAKGGKVATRAQFGAKLGRHNLVEQSIDSVVRDARSHPYLVWQTGLTDGSRYDVKTFTLTVTYVGLGPPQP